MRSRSAVAIIVGVSLQAGLMCTPGFAATGTTSLSVSVTVNVGCQVSPAGPVVEWFATRPLRWDFPVSVNCSQPVPYQVSFDRAPMTDSVGLGSGIGSLTARPGNLRVYDRDLHQRGEMLIEPIERSESGRIDEHVSQGLPAGHPEAAHPAAVLADPGIITVTVIY